MKKKERAWKDIIRDRSAQLIRQSMSISIYMKIDGFIAFQFIEGGFRIIFRKYFCIWV